MFSHADRFPLGPRKDGGPETPRPWGLTRMEPFSSVVDVDEVAIDLDPATQLTRYRGPDGQIRMAPGKHSKSRVGTEKGTSTSSRGDGAKAQPDTDHTQDTRID